MILTNRRSPYEMLQPHKEKEFCDDRAKGTRAIHSASSLIKSASMSTLSTPNEDGFGCDASEDVDSFTRGDDGDKLEVGSRLVT